MLLHEGAEAYKQEGRAQVHAAPGRQAEGQGQTPMIWAGKTSLSITPTRGWKSALVNGDTSIRFSPFSARRAKSCEKTPQTDLQDKT
jgi:hypothetical protein